MEFLDFLEQNKIEFRLNEKLSDHTNFKIGGTCKVLIFPKSLSQLVRVLKFLKTSNTKFYILGAGTNVLCSDNGFDGVVIKLGGHLKNYKIQGTTIQVEAGMNLFELNRILLNNNLTGLEFSYGIPGSVGGAVYMNAGAYNKSVGEFVKNVKVFDGEKIRTLNPKELDFSYRHSNIQNTGWTILTLTFEFQKGEFEQIKASQSKFLQSRLNSQPYHQACAGSVFKRLEAGKTPVSKMIDDLGLKGYTIGDAQVSTIHAGFIVNKGKATCKDVKSLIQYIQNKIKSSYNQQIELEIIILGDTDDT